MSDKNLIIGAATGFNKYDLFNFIESLRKVYFEDVILIMNNKIDSETNHYLNLNKISIFLLALHQEQFLKIDIRFI